MGSIAKLAVKDTTAAQMLDMSPKDFRALVEAGALPPALPIGEHQRWLVADLEAIITGKKIRPDTGFDL
ncbi:MAG: helix-turn-helix domain-containing protein [Proteobacteria bacterium]|nr:helix-turn-helix domain-containing protein [Pseudomonadota bacterium]